MVAIASCHGEVTSTILQTMMDKSETELKDTHSRFLALGLALTYLGKQVNVVNVVNVILIRFNVKQDVLSCVWSRAWQGSVI